ncbi:MULTISPECIES: sulfate adenylyltransferase subunit CysN [unclassified Wenzhouxiangella]|uniref:sulfate adenylyltransferase subunit CysN n=1 Tax=unclassified Wenzhouxiangella TaxID=2613841 RepID=UPI000E32BC2C|nr:MULTISPECIES: sulfate adenylyltransferase subunit CysN [unclassified Wenzhouxiangella]RFF27890.1 sulfate adenylyltransferase subunit CysN [Wenzhouxiangella sp. 15181]RFP68985.1 sulfate adenylyltransferase subunit CysN [Wenzhouxiangella sp. 15190]
MAVADIKTYLASHETKPLLRFITCGSVDDGKSTLIGRLLHDSKLLFDDQLSALQADSRRHGTQGEKIDFALLVDGLSAEREQGITIDVAYRFFDTDRAKFIVADCPGHEQYTRNMATGASTSRLAVVLIDARKGVLTQTRRHSWICRLMGIEHVVLAINKMDLVDYDRDVYESIASDYRALAAELGIERVSCIPVSALEGDNMISRSDRMPWYEGPVLLEALEGAAEQEDVPAEGAFRLPVQWVCRPDQNFRGFAGTLLGGPVAVGDEVTVVPSGKRSRVASLHVGTEQVDGARAGQPVVLALEDEVDVSRGDVLVASNDPLEVADQFSAHLLWMGEHPLMPHRSYRVRIGTLECSGQVGEIKYQVDVNNQDHIAARKLELNAVARVDLDLDRNVAFAPYEKSRELGSFVLIDRQTNATVGAGVIDYALRRAQNVHWQSLEVDKAARSRIKVQQPKCVWLTGLSGSGKSTIANEVERKLMALGHHTYLLDGDNVRHGLNRDLGFTEADRVENIRRVGEVARLMTDAGLIVLVSFISPFRSERRMVRERFDDDEFMEVFVDTPLEVCEERDVKGLYAKARAGEIPNFTGISSPYEAPENAELVLKTVGRNVEELADEVIELLGV